MSTERRRIADSELAPLIIGVAVFIFFLLAASSRLAVPDVAMQLHLASQTIEGARYGRDLLEINPPLFAWIAVPAVAIARAISVDRWQAFVLFIGSLQMLTTALVLVMYKAGQERRQFLWWSVAVVLMVCVVLPLDFGQREHIIFVSLLPYVLLAPRRMTGVRISSGLAIICAALAAVAIALKPHYVLVLGLLEFRVLNQKGVRFSTHRVEPWLVAVLGALYLAAVALFSPEYFDFLRTHASAYSAYNSHSLVTTLLLAPLQFAIMLALVSWSLAASHIGRLSELSTCLLLAMLGALGAAAMQGKGFPYHYHPAQAFAVFLLLAVAADLRCRRESSSTVIGSLRLPLMIVHGVLFGWFAIEVATVLSQGGRFTLQGLARIAAVPCFIFFTKTVTGEKLQINALRSAANVSAAIAVVIVTIQTASASFGSALQPGIDPDLPKLLEVIEERPGQTVAVLAINPASSWPLMLVANAEWALRYSTLGFLASFYPPDTSGRVIRQGRGLASRTGTKRIFHNIVVEDLVHRRPRQIITVAPDSSSNAAWGRAAQYDFISYLSVDTRFADLLRRYGKPRPIGHYHVYTRDEGV